MKNGFKSIIKLHHEGYSPVEISDELSVSLATVYRYLDNHRTSLSIAGKSTQLSGSDRTEEEDFEEEEFEEGEIPLEEEPTDHPGYIISDEELDLKERELQIQERLERKEKNQKRHEAEKSLTHLLSILEEDETDASEIETALEETNEKVMAAFDFDREEVGVSAAGSILSEIKDLLEEGTSELKFKTGVKMIMERCGSRPTLNGVSVDKSEFHNEISLRYLDNWQRQLKTMLARGWTRNRLKNW